MNRLILKPFFVSLLLLPASQISAQENESTVVEVREEAACNPFPKCKWLDGSSETASEEEKSQWLLLWENLTNEMKEALDGLPAPTQPE